MPGPASSPTTSKPQPQSPPFLISSLPALRSWLVTCPVAQTAVSFCPQYDAYLLIPVVCDRWSCRFCAGRKISRLAKKTEQAKPNRLMTLTVDPKVHASPRDAFDSTRRCVPELIRSLRTKFGAIEYLRVTEVTAKGWPHYHLLIRSEYLPHACVKKIWQDLTKASIVDLRQVKETFAAYSYLVKYLSKLHKIEWTERHVSYSRAFFPPNPADTRTPLDFLHRTVEPLHPVTFLARYYSGEKITQVGRNLYLLPNEPRNPDAEPLPEPPPPSDSYSVPPRLGPPLGKTASKTIFVLNPGPTQ